MISGARTPPHWSSPGKPPDYDLWDLKGLLEATARAAGAPGVLVVPEGAGWVLRDASGAPRGWAGRLEADSPAWAAPLLGLEMDLDPAATRVVTYRPLPVTPPVERDLALVLPAGLAVARVEEVLGRVAGPLLEQARVFDEYRAAAWRGRSVAWHLVFRAPDRTLRDEEVDAILRQVLAALREELNVELRAT
ncbi:MAG: hypothetical protein HY560_10465 [Gemmatimonadetes bacterium]|nr:hypothetical protein [Gemmatimonadota bacterium]